jgi:hypothetical protein
MVLFSCALLLVPGRGMALADPASATTRVTVPKIPTSVVVGSRNTALAVSRSAPASDGGSPVTGYIVTASLAGSPTEGCDTARSTSCLVTGIVNPSGKAKSRYTVKVTAYNAIGTGHAAKTRAAGTTVLVGADVHSSNLQGASLVGAHLQSAPVTNAYLVDADLTGALLGGITWSNTTCPGGTNSSAYLPQTCVGH